jgi:hypothetical protein
MAILAPGMLCRLCGKPLLEGQEKVAFSTFVANEADPLWKFSDGVFHVECFNRDSLADSAEKRWREFSEHRISSLRRCHVCGQPIENPDDYFALGHLTNDSSHPLYRLNFAVFHRSHLAHWPELASIYQLASAQVKSGAWKGRGMQWIVDTLKNAMPK